MQLERHFLRMYLLMTIDEVLEIGKQKLTEYEPHLNVKGTKPYDKHAVHLHEDYKGRSLPSRYTIQHMIETVIGKLVEQKDGFWMSEPEPNLDTPIGLEHGPSLATVRHNNVNLTFSSDFSGGGDDTHSLRVQCWYYPA
jgi:hypothetical protein